MSCGHPHHCFVHGYAKWADRLESKHMRGLQLLSLQMGWLVPQKAGYWSLAPSEGFEGFLQTGGKRSCVPHGG